MQPENTEAKRYGYCLLGAVTPIIISLPYYDFQKVYEGATGWIVFGYLLKVCVLLFSGGIAAFLYTEERDPKKLFQLGIAAPALISALLAQGQQHARDQGMLDFPSLIGTANAQQSAPPQPASQQSPQAPENTLQSLPAAPSPVQQVIQGLTGIEKPLKYWVIVASSGTAQGAQDMATEFQKKWSTAVGNDPHWSTYTVQAFAPYTGTIYYPVVLAGGLDRDEAFQLRDKALQVGLPNDTFVWKDRVPLDVKKPN